MMPEAAVRLVIIGNSGSGKSTLAERLSTVLHAPTYDLDLLHWHADGSKRVEAEAKVLMADVAANDAWVIEGVYGWLVEVALVRATALVWLDLSWAECREGLLQRGLRRGMTSSDQDALLAWAAAYWTRTTSSSSVGHTRLFQAFKGTKAHLQTRADVVAFSPASFIANLRSAAEKIE